MPFTASDICKIILAIFLPPLGVFLERGCGADLLINILLTVLGCKFAFNNTPTRLSAANTIPQTFPASSTPCTSSSSTRRVAVLSTLTHLTSHLNTTTVKRHHLPRE